MATAPTARRPPWPGNPRRRSVTYPPRLIRYTTGIILAALPVVAAAPFFTDWSGLRRVDLLGIALFALAATVAGLKPVPLDDKGSRSVSLSFVFILAEQTLFGWDVGRGRCGRVHVDQPGDRTRRAQALALQHGRVRPRDRPLGVARSGRQVECRIGRTGRGPPDGDCLRGRDGLRARERPARRDRRGARTGRHRALHAGRLRTPRRAGVSRHGVHRRARNRALREALSDARAAAGGAALRAVALAQRYADRSVVATTAAETDGLTGLRNHRAFQDDLRAGRMDRNPVGEVCS